MKRFLFVIEVNNMVYYILREKEMLDLQLTVTFVEVPSCFICNATSYINTYIVVLNLCIFIFIYFEM